MENNSKTGASRDRNDAQRSSETEKNAGQSQKTDQKANNINVMPPVLAGDKSARPSSQDQGAQNSKNKEADDEALETADDSEDDATSKQAENAPGQAASSANRKQNQSSAAIEK